MPALAGVSTFQNHMKYKQYYIPKTQVYPSQTQNQLRAQIRDYYKAYIQGSEVTNQHIGINIKFTSEGIGKISSNRRIGRLNASAVKVIDTLLKHAEYSNFSKRKSSDKNNVIGYLNFKAKAEISGKIHHFRIAVKLKTDMKAYYNHTVNRYPGWK
jgi:hypothetical protein